MSEKRFIYEEEHYNFPVKKRIRDTQNNETYDLRECCELLNEQDKEIGLLRLELDTHRHPLWSTRKAERKLSEVTDSLANEVKRNGLLNEEINQLRIENMRLKKKGGDGV